MSSKPRGVGILPISPTKLQAEATKRQLAFWPGGVLPDWAIREFITIDDFVDYGECPPGVISYGLSSAGYDLRVGTEFKVFNNVSCATIDPRNLSPDAFTTFDLAPTHKWEMDNSGLVTAYVCRWCHHPARTFEQVHYVTKPCVLRPDKNFITIPPNSFALARSVERLEIPRNVICLTPGKSTYARSGISVNLTPFEPGWRGVVTIEISNGTPLPVKIFANQGIVQVVFFLLCAEPENSYGEKPNPHYQDQTGITLPRV